MDQDVFWSSILNREEPQNLPDFLLSPNDTTMSYTNMSTENSPSLNIWNSAEPNSGDQSSDQEDNDETKMELGWPIEGDNILSLDDVDINLNNTQINDEQTFQFSLNSDLNDTPQDFEQNVVVSESVLFSHPYVPTSLQHVKGPSSSNSHGNSSNIDYDDRPGSSIDGRRLACKRKNIEGVQGQSSSTSGNSITFNASESNNANSGINISSPSSTITQRTNPIGNSAASVEGNSENSSRNFRLRINPARQHNLQPPSLSSSRNTVQNNNNSLANEPSANLIAFNRRLESRATNANSTPQYQSEIPIVYANLQPWIRTPNSRSGSSSNLPNPVDILAAIREESTARNAQNSRNETSVQPLLFPPNVANGSASSTGSVRSTSRERQPISRGMGEASHRRLLASVDSETRGHIRNFLMHHSPSSTLQEIGRGSQQGDGGPSSTRLVSREGRSRVISEIRNALDLMRRGERLRFEDVFMLDHPLFHGVADIHDRHRDMRLDVDNMSYEELLALEERIGNVSTGLSEEKILTRLKQHKHFYIDKGAAVENEPCCICQEEYVEGEDLGTLDCSHDFHVACLKQWLMQKNLCPICKTTALVT